MTSGDGSSSAAGLLPGGGEMGERIRSFDWAATPLGAIESWPLSLRTIVSVVYLSRHPMYLFWGPHHIGLYNDAYRQSLGPDRHPEALGRPGRETWDEIWATIGPQIESVMANGDATWYMDQYLPITRGDHLEDAFWSYSHSAVPDDHGSVGGVLVTVQETTTRVLAERRLRLIQEMADRELDALTMADACVIAARVLAGHPADVPCGVIYLRDPESDALRLAAAVGVEPGSEGAPLRVHDIDAHRAAFQEACGGLVGHSEALPIITGTTGSIAGFLVVAGNPRLPVDDEHRAFLTQLAREIGTALYTVETREARHRAVREAAAAELALLADVFKLSPSFLAVLRGPRHVFELTNPAYAQLVGHRDVVGKPVAEALPEAAGQGFVALLDRVYATGVPFVGSEISVHVQHTRGGPLEERYLNFVYQPIRDATGAISGVHVNGVDVTELVRQRQIIEREAAEHDVERRQLLTVLEQSPLGILIFEPTTGRRIFSNDAFRMILGYDEVPDSFDVISGHWRRLDWNGESLAPDASPVARALSGGVPVTNELLLVEHIGTGRRIELAETAAPVRDAQGKIIAAVVIFADATTERRTERQLREAERMQAVGTLAGGVAHEINNQMTAVLGFGSFVLQALGPDHPQAADMRLVLQSAERTARISQQLLAFTRQQTTQREVVDLGATVIDLRPVLTQLLGSDKTLSVTVADDVKPVSADPDQIQQVVINLVANARDAMETGGELRISVEPAALTSELDASPGESVAPGEYTVLSVRDDGQGMGREVLARIFEPFFTTKQVGKGSGLGLPMVYGTMRRHGGYVVVRSSRGGGTKVDLYWPLAGTGAQQSAERESGAAIGGISDANRGVVLLAEDEPSVRALVVRTLEAEGYQVVPMHDGMEAADALRTGRVTPSLVITDVIMPRLNGRQLSDIVNEHAPGVPVVFISGNTGDDTVLQRLIPAGATFLAKPFKPHDLVRIAAEALAAASNR